VEHSITVRALVEADFAELLVEDDSVASRQTKLRVYESSNEFLDNVEQDLTNDLDGLDTPSESEGQNFVEKFVTYVTDLVGSWFG
jgi:hypothetical protein